MLVGADPKEGINAVQTIRNTVLGVSILAAASAVIGSQLINVLTDPTKLNQIELYGAIDPITKGGSIASPPVKVAIALGLLFMSLMAMMQCVRLSIHVGYGRFTAWFCTQAALTARCWASPDKQVNTLHGDLLLL